MKCRVLTGAGLIGYCVVAVAQHNPARLPFGPEAMLNDWGRLIYCQKVFADPAHEGRVTKADAEQCHAGEVQILSPIAGYDENVRKWLRVGGRQRALRIENERGIGTEPISSCREFCSRMAAGSGSDGEAETE